MKNNELDDRYDEDENLNKIDEESVLVDQKQTRINPEIRRRLDDYREQQELKRLLSDVFDDDFEYLDDIA